MPLARVVQEFPAAERGDLALAVGDIVTVTEQSADGWWQGKIGGRKGLFPGNFVDLIPTDDGTEDAIEDIATPSCGPPAALRFAYEGAQSHETAVLHGLAAAYEGLFRLEPRREVKGRPAYRHTVRKDKWLAYNGKGWMAQQETHLGTSTGVLLLRDASCATPDESRGVVWRCNPGWTPLHGLCCVAMSEEEADRWEAEANPWGEGAMANGALDAIAQQLSLDPTVQRARDPSASLAERLQAMDELQMRQQQIAAAMGGGGGGGGGGGRGRGGGGRAALAGPGGAAGGGAGGGGATTTRVVPMGKGVLFVGSVGVKGGKPQGGGELVLRDGSVHVGSFESGAAHGDGVYYDKAGAVHTGKWVSNLRVGRFEVIDPKGEAWVDSYDDVGARTSRKRAPPSSNSAARAVVCRECGVRFHFGHNFACRRHRASWDGQRWPCCGASAQEETGCHLESAHEA